jgi:thioredoxin 1
MNGFAHNYFACFKNPMKKFILLQTLRFKPKNKRRKKTMVKPAVFTDTNFESEVVSSDKPVLVDFWAEWCGPCRVIGPVIEELAGEYEGKVKIGKVDVDNNRQVAMQLGIQGIPSLLIFKGGREVDRIVGAVPKSHIAARLNKVL